PSAALTSEDEATVSLARPGPSMRSRASKADSGISDVTVSAGGPTTGPRVRLRMRLGKKLEAAERAHAARLASATAEEGLDRVSESLEETKRLRRSDIAEAEISSERAVLESPLAVAEEDDDQEVTIAF